MSSFKLFSSALFALFYFSHFAFAIDLAVWKRPHLDSQFILPLKEGESPEAALARYLKAIDQNPSLQAWQSSFKDLAGGSDLTAFPLGNADKTTGLVLANDIKDMANGVRIQNATEALRKRGVRFFVAPLLADSGLGEAEKKEFHAKINQSFDFLLALGGADLNPALYGAEVSHAVKINAARDASEFGIVQSYLSDSRGFFMGICRGHQMGAVASSCGLVQDLEKEWGISGHQNSQHSIEWKPGQNSLWHQVFPDRNQVTVNSIHHQAVTVPKDSKLEILAVDSHGIVEVLGYPGERGLSVQFHPELMSESDMAPLWDTVAKQVRLFRDLRCNQLFSF